MDTAALLARGLLSNNDDVKKNKTVCPIEDQSGPEIVPFVGNYTWHSFATICSGACAILSFLIVFAVIIMHALNFSNPIQQRQIIRILLLVPWAAFFAFLIVWQEGAGEYLVESLDFGCAIALAAFLLLMCDYILASTGGSHELFGATSVKRADGKENSPNWFKRIWYMVLQFIPTSLIIWLATCITVAINIYCSSSNSVHFAHIWITVFKLIVTTLAVLADLKLYQSKKDILSQHRVVIKFFAFKGIIGLNALQTFILAILVGNKTLQPTKYMTYHDIKAGLPSFILALEMPLFAIVIALAFPASPYKLGQSPVAGPATALFQALNITDLLSCFVRGPMRLVRDQQWGIQRQSSMPLVANPGYPGYSDPPAYGDSREAMRV
ncbi:hypothetical protein P280DRAFT_485559 [Massarina eburnea CBS 473.64]|uniref:DUF300-domain-containing protein n=1 Tax=Massarina eburnea CBS 473.64 TaxID=1395130 RepID=A0A6A6RFV1_9PLEO|nr:hypothetical protein P280DRAFT_485559 [Massarina eburnea CBS 473.64]